MRFRDELLRYETALAARDPALAGGSLTDLLADDFVEIGASGRRWDRESIADLLGSADRRPVVVEDFSVAHLADDVVLATFTCAGSERSSIWIRRDGRWLLRFHQGTPSEG